MTPFRRGHLQGAVGVGNGPTRNVCHVRLFNGIQTVGETTVPMDAGPLEAVVVSPDLKNCEDVAFQRALALIRESVPRGGTADRELGRRADAAAGECTLLPPTIHGKRGGGAGRALERLHVFPAATGEFVSLGRHP